MVGKLGNKKAHVGDVANHGSVGITVPRVEERALKTRIRLRIETRVISSLILQNPQEAHSYVLWRHKRLLTIPSIPEISIATISIVVQPGTSSTRWMHCMIMSPLRILDPSQQLKVVRFEHLAQELSSSSPKLTEQKPGRKYTTYLVFIPT